MTTTSSSRLLQWGSERARSGAWRGDRRTALLSPVPGAPMPSAAFVRRCLDTLRADGFERVVTGALAAPEQTGFLAAGFEVRERLHLLRHDLVDVPEPPATPLRRASRGDRVEVLTVDALAFSEFWQLDADGLDEALAATPHTRFRVAVPDDEVRGYAVTGRAGRRGYVQRLAVHPAAEGAGIGRALLIDGLRWLRRWRVEEAMVNTQLGNERALALYERLGFRRQPTGLNVLGRELGL